jgi:hypothetical protein
MFSKKNDKELEKRIEKLENKLNNLVKDFQGRALLGDDHSSEKDWGFFGDVVTIDGELHRVSRANGNRQLRYILYALMDYLGVEYVEEMVKEIRKKEKEK